MADSQARLCLPEFPRPPARPPPAPAVFLQGLRDREVTLRAVDGRRCHLQPVVACFPSRQKESVRPTPTRGRPAG